MTVHRNSTLCIEVSCFAGCPNLGPTLTTVRACLALIGVEVSIVKREGDFASPTVLVNGRDVMGNPDTSGRACRCDLPTEERVLDALLAALGKASV